MRIQLSLCLILTSTILDESFHTTLLQDFPVILKRVLQNYWKILKKYFLSTTCINMKQSESLQSHSDVLTVSMGSTTITVILKWSLKKCLLASGESFPRKYYLILFIIFIIIIWTYFMNDFIKNMPATHVFSVYWFSKYYSWWHYITLSFNTDVFNK